MRLVISIAFVAAAVLCASAERQPFERYQTVVERQMFGPPPEGFDPTKRPSEVAGSRDARKQAQELTKEQEKLKSAVHFSMINITPSGETAVGFTDRSDSKNPKNYYLKVGESRDGWTVKEADAAASSMTVVKGDIEVSLTIGGDSSKGAGKTASAAANGGGTAGRPAGAGGGIGSLRARRNQRRAEEAARLAAFDKQMKEREAAFEKRQQEDREAREAREAQEKEEKAKREAEREEQRQQLLKIQEELKRAREEKAKEKPESDAEDE